MAVDPKKLLLAAILLGCAPQPVVVSSSNPHNTTPQGSHGGSGSKSYVCKSHSGCTVTVDGKPEHYGYGAGAPVACGAGIVVIGCGCGYEAPASCSCGEAFQPSPSCSPSSCSPASPPSCSQPSCGSGPSCGSSCGGSGCGTSIPPSGDRDR
jgi:hypothetical protein